MHRALAEVEAGDIPKRQIGNLSGGQLQRVLVPRESLWFMVALDMLLLTMRPIIASISRWCPTRSSPDCGAFRSTSSICFYGPDLPAGTSIGFRTKRPIVEVLGTCAQCDAKRDS